ncbi:hypothetical protein HDV00_000686 [Rhizophlyctis rosea]|nr:hypothetical protein HDV00_000686 [Rhizophlyctis rosea]
MGVPGTPRAISKVAANTKSGWELRQRSPFAVVGQQSPLDADALQCPICFEVFTDPVTFDTCGHSLCLECLNQMLEAAPNSNCPTCRSRIIGALRKSKSQINEKLKQRCEQYKKRQPQRQQSVPPSIKRVPAALSENASKEHARFLRARGRDCRGEGAEVMTDRVRYARAAAAADEAYASSVLSASSSTSPNITPTPSAATSPSTKRKRVSPERTNNTSMEDQRESESKSSPPKRQKTRTTCRNTILETNVLEGSIGVRTRRAGLVSSAREDGPSIASCMRAGNSEGVSGRGTGKGKGQDPQSVLEIDISAVREEPEYERPLTRRAAKAGKARVEDTPSCIGASSNGRTEDLGRRVTRRSVKEGPKEEPKIGREAQEQQAASHRRITRSGGSTVKEKEGRWGAAASKDANAPAGKKQPNAATSEPTVGPSRRVTRRAAALMASEDGGSEEGREEGRRGRRGGEGDTRLRTRASARGKDEATATRAGTGRDNDSEGNGAPMRPDRGRRPQPGVQVFVEI